MNRRNALIAAIGLAALPLAAWGQPVGKIPRLGYFMDRGGPTAFDEAFLDGMRRLGYVPGQNIQIEYRWAEGRADRLPILVGELVSLKVDAIVTAGAPATLAAKRATTTIPIVMASSQDAVADGLVASLAKPGGNVTGESVFAAELAGKRLEILKETIPKLSRVGVLYNAANPGNPPQFQKTSAAAKVLGLQVRAMEARIPDDLESAFAEVAKWGANAVVILSDSSTITNRSQIAAAAAKHRIATIFANRAYLEGGGLMSYGPDILQAFRHAANFVDKVLKGAKPANLPVEQPTRFELAINLKTAKALGLAISPSILARADRVIE
jgi:putative ABC transport system substrate-binding protein